MQEKVYRNPSLAADVIVFQKPLGKLKVLLIERKNEPFGWALPGGFVDYGESCESAAIRELEEETNLVAKEVYQLGIFSEPDRDPRQHVASVAFLASSITGIPNAKDDAKNLAWFDIEILPTLAFPDHITMISTAKAFTEMAESKG